MSTLKVNNLQVGQDATASNNFTLYQPAVPDGTVRLGVGNSGSVSDLLTINDSSAKLKISTLTGTTGLNVIGLDTNGYADVEITSVGTSGSSRLYFSDTAGKVGSIIYSHSDNSLNFATNGGTTDAKITSDGNVLVGNTATGSLGGNQPAIQVDRPQSSVLNASILIRENEASTSWPKLYLSKNRSDNPMGPDNKLGSIEFYGDNGSNDELGARIEAAADGATFWSASSRPTRLVFSVTPNGSTTLTEALRIDPTGNVGIGTTNPIQKLNVEGNALITGYTKVGGWVTKTWGLDSPLNGTSVQHIIHSTTANNVRFIHGEVIIMPSRSGLNQQRGHVRYAISYSFYNGNLYGYITELERTGVVGFSNLTLTSGVVSGTTANIYVNATSDTAALGGISVKFEGILYGH